MQRMIMLFCMGAAAATAADMTDFDGDGLPDVWEASFGLRTNSAAGVDGPYGDPDCDGLSNLAEYKAGYYAIGANVYSNAAGAIAGLCPTNGHSVDASVWDAYLRPAGTNECLRWIYMDRDFVDDSWEMTNACVSVDTADDKTVVGARTAWDLCRESHHPGERSVSFRFFYSGVHVRETFPIVVQFYGDPEMNGPPDANASVISLGEWDSPLSAIVTNWSGTVHSGTNYVFAFLDLSGNGAWDAGEPCGVATPFGNDIGWDYNRINVQFTDYTPGYLRMDLTGKRSEDVISGVGTSGGGASAATSALETRVRVLRSSADGYSTYQRIVLDKMMKSSRAGLHEGDLLGQGDLGLDWGLIGVPTSMNRERLVYDVYIGDATLLTNNLHVTTFTNWFDVAEDRVQAQASSPINGKYVYSARPTFKWTMPDRYIAFAIEIKMGTSSGTTIWSSATLQQPVRDPVTGECVWTAPICVGDTLTNACVFSNNCSYAWRVIALNSKFTLTTTPITWSAWNMFSVQVPSANRPSSFGKMNCIIGYAGASENRNVSVEAFDNAGFGGLPMARCTFSGSASLTNIASFTTNATLIGLSPGNYYVRAYLDLNTNGVLDCSEPWGYANHFGECGAFPYDPRATEIKAAGPAPTATVTIEDAGVN